jgi:hypothetical protein
VNKIREVYYKDHVLLQNSHVIESDSSYKWFKKLLNNYDEITTDVVESLDKDKKNFFDNMLPKLKKQAIGEWELISDQLVVDSGEDPEERQHCSICNTRIRYICSIKNKLNGNELHIGTTCAEHFGFNGDRSIRSLRIEAKRLGRANILNEKFPGIADIKGGWKDKINKFEVIIPNKYEKPYFKLYDRLKKLYDDFLNEDEDENCFDEIEDILNKGKKMLNEMEDYSQKNKDDIYVPNISVGKWLRKNNEYDTLNKLKEDGRYGIGTIHRITKASFVKRILPEINDKIFKKVNAEIVENRGAKYIYKFKSSPNINLVVSYSEIVLNYCYSLFDKPLAVEFSKNKFLNKSKIADVNSYETLLKYLEYKMESKLYYYDFEYDDMFIFNGEYYEYEDLKSILEKFKLYYFNIKKDQFKLSRSFNGKKHSKSDVDELIRGRQYI